MEAMTKMALYEVRRGRGVDRERRDVMGAMTKISGGV